MIILVTEKRGTFKLDSKANTGIIYVPADITKDSGFPLRPRKVKIYIEGNRLIIEPLPHFEHIQISKNNATIFDNERNQKIIVYFREGDVYCGFCEKVDCEHITFIHKRTDPL